MDIIKTFKVKQEKLSVSSEEGEEEAPGSPPSQSSSSEDEEPQQQVERRPSVVKVKFQPKGSSSSSSSTTSTEYTDSESNRSSISPPPQSEGEEEPPEEVNLEEGSESDDEDDLPRYIDDLESESVYFFCPRCHNLLETVFNDESDCYTRECATCPYYFNVTRSFRYETVIEHPEIDESQEVYDMNVINESRDTTQTSCPECSHQQAYFYQMQTRSADEPMTNFYECIKCSHKWRD